MSLQSIYKHFASIQIWMLLNSKFQNNVTDLIKHTLFLTQIEQRHIKTWDKQMRFWVFTYHIDVKKGEVSSSFNTPVRSNSSKAGPRGTLYLAVENNWGIDQVHQHPYEIVNQTVPKLGYVAGWAHLYKRKGSWQSS